MKHNDIDFSTFFPFRNFFFICCVKENSINVFSWAVFVCCVYFSILGVFKMNGFHAANEFMVLFEWEKLVNILQWIYNWDDFGKPQTQMMMING